MHKNKSYLFIGNFLSKTRGTINPSEYIIRYFNHDLNLSVIKASSFESQVLRFMEILLKASFGNYQTMHIDVFSNKAFTFADWASRIAVLRGKTVILNLHGGQLTEFHTRNSKSVEKVFGRAHQILTPSLFLKKYFEQLNFDIQYLPNFVNLDQFPFKRDNVQPKTILWVRAFTEIYNPEMAIRAIALVKERFKDIKMTMIGPDKGLRQSCENLIEELSLTNNVKILGRIDHKELAHYYQSHEVYLNTTSYESFGVALLEAIASGIPVVTSAVGEISEVWVNQEEVLFSKSIHPEHFAEGIFHLLEQPDKASNMAKKAYEKSKTFHWDAIKKLWQNLVLNNN